MVSKGGEKVILSLSMPRRHAGGLAAQLHSFLTSALGRGKWSNSLPGRVTPEMVRGSRYPLNRRVGGPQRLYGHFEGDKNMFPVGTGTAELPAHRLIIISGMFGKCLIGKASEGKVVI